MKTKAIGIFLALAVLVAFSETPAPRSEPPLSLYVATLMYQDNAGGLNLMSYSDAEATPEPVAAHVAEYLEKNKPGSKILSLRVDVVGMEELEKVFRSRHPRAHF